MLFKQIDCSQPEYLAYCLHSLFINQRELNSPTRETLYSMCHIHLDLNPLISQELHQDEFGQVILKENLAGTPLFIGDSKFLNKPQEQVSPGFPNE